MEFESLEEAGTLEIEYLGRPLDLYSFGIFHLNMQDIIDKVTFWLLSQEGLLEPSWKRPKYLPIKPPPAYRRFIRAEIRELQTGSLHEALTFAIVAVLADPDVRAVLQNLVANVIWAIGLSGVRGVVKRRVPPPPNIPPLRRRPDPFDIGPNLRDIVLAIAESNGEEGSEITFRYHSPRYETMEVTIRIGGRYQD